MSDLLRQSITSSSSPSTSSSRPRPSTLQAPSLSYNDMDDSSSSDSSASSAASIATVRPSSREHEASAGHWTRYFDQELFLDSSSSPSSTSTSSAASSTSLSTNEPTAKRPGPNTASSAGTQRSRYHVYLTTPSDLKKGPLFICHHGAGASGMSFAMFAQMVRERCPTAGVLSLEARGHGSVVYETSSSSTSTAEDDEKSGDGGKAPEKEIIEYSLDALASDAVAMIELTKAKLNWSTLPPCVLVGHSLGGAVVTTLATTHFRVFGASLIGYSVLDVVEGSAIEALANMKTYLASRPKGFETVEEGVQWHLRTRTIRDRRSAEASVPSLLVPVPSGAAASGSGYGPADADANAHGAGLGPDHTVASSTGNEKSEGKQRYRYTWRSDLSSTQPWWEEWFAGMSKKFLTGKGAKQLILAGTDRLDKELMIGQMQGKFQLVVIPEAGHFVHEDTPEKCVELLVEFARRNDRSQLVLPMKVGEMLKAGMKV